MDKQLLNEINETIPKDDLILTNQLLEKELIKFKKAYHLLMTYFDSIADEEKEKVSKELEKLGL